MLLALFLAQLHLISGEAVGKVGFDSSRKEWILRSGNVEYKLGENNGIVYLEYFGPAGQPRWEAREAAAGAPTPSPARYEIAGTAEGEALNPEDLRLISQSTSNRSNDVDELELVYRHSRLPLQITVKYSTWAETGVLTRQVTLLNKGAQTLRVESLPSLALQLPKGKYELTYLWGGWGHERQLAFEALSAGERSFVSTRGRSTNGYSPWFCLRSETLGVRFLAQLAYSGNWQMSFYERYHLNFAKPEVREWARSIIDRLVKDYGIEWLKIDYNIDIGDRFDPPGLMERHGHVLYDHLSSYYKWLDDLRVAYPSLVIENCSSGGTRFDLGIMAHTHTTWLSDEVRPLQSVQLGYGCSVEFIPEVCNHWMVGDKDNGEIALSNPPGWWEFMLRVPMGGQFGISSRVLDWNADLIKTVSEGVALYKRIRRVIRGSDVYYLTPQPSHENPTGWCALQFVSANQKESVLMAYRLGNSDAMKVFKLRGLDPAKSYRISLDGINQGEVGGETLSTSGFQIYRKDEWRAAVVELQEGP